MRQISQITTRQARPPSHRDATLCSAVQINVSHWLHVIAGLMFCATLSGCAGKSLIDDNPVIAETPPRIKLANRATTRTVSADNKDTTNPIRTVSHTSSTKLEGNTVVAEVNGRPIFVDDLIGSMRLTLEADPNIPPDQRQEILHVQVKGRLQSYVDQEIVLQALRRAIPEDRQDEIRESLMGPFGEVLGNIKRDNDVQTESEMNEILAQQGLSVDLLRESFMRIQMVQGYLSSVTEVNETVDRMEMVKYYNDHKDEFTSEERVRAQEIVVLFNKNGGRQGAEAKMTHVVKELQKDRSFADLAMEYSDALSAEKRGDIGWLNKGSLADKNVDAALFALPEGKMTKVYVRDDRFEVYRVVDHQLARTSSFTEVQQSIEDKIKQGRRDAARTKAMDKLRGKAIVVTIYDDEKESNGSDPWAGET